MTKHGSQSRQTLLPRSVPAAQHALRRDSVQYRHLHLRRHFRRCDGGGAKAHDFEQDAEHAAIAMEYVDGWSLWTMRVDKPSGVFEANEIAPCVADFSNREADGVLVVPKAGEMLYHLENPPKWAGGNGD